MNSTSAQLLRIGDFSRVAQVSVPTLRHYDEIGLLLPAHIDKFTDYRHYSLDQLPRLNRILAFKDLGFALDEIANLLDDDVTPEQIRGMLRLRMADATRQMREEAQRLQRIESRLRRIEQEGRAPAYDVTLKQLPQQRIVGVRRMVPTLREMAEHRCAMYASIYDTLREAGVRNAGPELMMYHNEEFIETDIDMEAAVTLPASADAAINRLPVLAGVRLNTLAASPETVCAVHRGATFDVTQAIVAVFQWMADNGYRCAHSAVRELHHYGRENELIDINAPVVLEIQVPVQRV
jgi:DNA-binding transcriptional MerR regulator